MSPEQQAILAIIQQVEMKPARTSPPSLASDKIRYEADSRPGMVVYFSGHDFGDPQVPPYVAMTYPGRNFCDPPLLVLQNILAQLSATP
jgi:hypothetical protein